MSDVLIKDMEMPKGCVECPLILAYGSRLENKIIHHCMGRLPEDSRFSDDADLTKRPKEGCPLVEVKPHGRLIDIDKLKKDAFEKGVDVALTLRDEGTVIACTAIPLKQFFDLMDDQPTVLEATNE